MEFDINVIKKNVKVYFQEFSRIELVTVSGNNICKILKKKKI